MTGNYVYEIPGTPIGKINYYINEPKDFDKTSESLPLLIMLHGARGLGDDIERVKKLSMPAVVQAEPNELPVRAVVMVPQCPRGFVWNHFVYELKSLIDKVVEEYNIDKKRICLSGGSMGGFGAWEMGLTFPNFFAGIVAICGGGMSWRSGAFRTTPVRAYHHIIDTTVPYEYSKLMVEAVNKSGGKAELITLEGQGHDPAPVYRDTDALEWLLNQQRG